MGLTIGPLHVRRSILVQASPERVWQEFESFERLGGWFGIGHELLRYEPKPGGVVELCITDDGERLHYGGPIVVFEPARELSFESNWHGDGAWPVPTFFTLRLTPLYDGTRVEIFHHGFERLGAEAAETLQGYEEGWDVKHLKALRASVEP